MAKKQNFKNNSPEELRTLVETKRVQLRDLRFGAAGGKNKNVKFSRTLRREVARALTELGTKV